MTNPYQLARDEIAQASDQLGVNVPGLAEALRGQFAGELRRVTAERLGDWKLYPHWLEATDDDISAAVTSFKAVINRTEAAQDLAPGNLVAEYAGARLVAGNKAIWLMSGDPEQTYALLVFHAWESGGKWQIATTEEGRILVRAAAKGTSRALPAPVTVEAQESVPTTMRRLAETAFAPIAFEVVR